MWCDGLGAGKLLIHWPSYDIGDGILTSVLVHQKMTIAEQIAGKLNAKLNYIPKTAQEEEEEKEEPKKTTFRKYEEELEINDFPQTARWKVTSKVSVQRVSLLR